MKITSIDIYDLLPEIANQGIAPICIRINTDEGICGFGEVGTGYGNAHYAGVNIVRDLGRRIIGKDPLNIEAIWEDLFRNTFWGMAGGVLVSDEVVNGVVGHNDYDVAGFGNIDVIPVKNVAFGVEYKQGVNAGNGIRNHDYFDAHVAWFATPKLTLVGAFVATGDKDKFYRHGSAKDLGVGSGFVLSAQYQF